MVSFPMNLCWLEKNEVLFSGKLESQLLKNLVKIHVDLLRVQSTSEIRTIDRLVNRHSDFERSVRLNGRILAFYSINTGQLTEIQTLEQTCSDFER